MVKKEHISKGFNQKTGTILMEKECNTSNLISAQFNCFSTTHTFPNIQSRYILRGPV